MRSRNALGRSIRSRLASAASAAVGLAALAVPLLAATPAWAAASVTVSGANGAVLSPDNATEVTVTGSGFQAIQNGFGGVYVLFGWVDDAAGGSWRPSNGGVVGDDYRYVPDAESADNAGYQRFLAFAGSSTESSANGVLAADGSWSIDMVIPGATFESQNRAGETVAVDCREVTCGILTIGAHGVKNANNETFTPVSFAAAAAVPAAGGAAAQAPPDAGAAPAAPAGSARVGVESEVVRAGNAIVFTGQGFTPGEQVMASLDGGLAAVGPLTAGAQGEVAAALPVPANAQNGTHLLTLRGAASGFVAESQITVTDGAGLVTASAAAPETPAWVVVVLLASIVIALVLIVTSVVTAIVRARRRRARRRAAPTATADAALVPDAVPVRDAAPTADAAPVPDAVPATRSNAREEALR